MEEILLLFRCPISKKLFKNPVLADDDTVYEKYELVKLISENRVSPITNKKINIFNDVKNIKHFLDNLIDHHPILETLRFDDKFMDECMVFSYKKNDIISELKKNNDFRILKKYKMIDLKTFDRDLLRLLVKSDFDTFKYVIKNSINAFTTRCGGDNILNIAGYYFSNNAVKNMSFLLEIGFDPNSKCRDDGWTAMHQICTHYSSDFDFIKLGIEKGGDLLIKNIDGIIPLETICELSNFDIIKFAIEKTVIEKDLVNILISRIYDNKKLSGSEKTECSTLISSKVDVNF